MENICVVIRHSGERTFELCQALVKKAVPAANVATVTGVPFSQTLRRSFEMGIERRLEWTLVVDADILIRPTAVQSLMRMAPLLGGKVFELQGKIMDRLGGIRTGGPKLYRTALLPQALASIPDEDVPRPEETTILRMCSQGFVRIKLDTVLSLHDYEQWHRDLFRKAFFYVHKFSDAISSWEAKWRESVKEDQDFQVALLGANAGRRFGGKVLSDVRQFDGDLVSAELAAAGIEEKTPLCLNSCSIDVQATIEQGQYHPR